jgi:hypothetical protein
LAEGIGKGKVQDMKVRLLFGRRHRTLFFLSVVVLSCAIGASGLSASSSFDKEDRAAMEHLSRALMAWYEVNQLGQPQSHADVQRVLRLMKEIHVECGKVPDKTLAKIDSAFLHQWRDNLEKGAELYELGMREYYNAVKRGESMPAPAKSQMSDGQARMLKFHRYYNSNIERIVADLQARGIEIF